MASSVTELLLVILLIYAKVQNENAVAQQTDLDASYQNATDLVATSAEPIMPRVPTIPPVHIGCPELCDCKESEKRDGVIVDCTDRKLNFVPNSIPDRTIYVNLKKNLIRSLTNNSFAKWNTKRIQKVNLSQNNISHIDKYAFKNFSHLWVIDLSYNNISSVNKVRFPATHELNLEGNPMRLKPSSGFEESVFASSQSLSGDCYAIYRRVKTNPMDDHWKYLEHVSHVIANIKCAHEPFSKSTTEMVENSTITERTDATIAPESNITGSTLKNNLTITNIETSLSSNNQAVIENTSSNNLRNISAHNETTVNHSEMKSTTIMAERPTPTVYEAFFYGSLLVVFFLLILFLISQKYNHSCYKKLRKRFTRQSTRRSTVHGPIIHVHPVQRRQSRKPT